jgi:microcystin-dependent protein
MATTSPNLGLTLPTPNVDSGWGATLNTDFTLIDDLFLANGSGTSVGIQVGSGKVANVGGTLVAGGTVILGSGDATNTVAAPTIRGTARTGTNAAGANLTIDAANGTGTGGSGKIVFRTAPAGTTGSVANTMQTAMEVNNDGSLAVTGGITTAGRPVAEFMPIGGVLPYAGSSAPSGWLLCFGQAVSRATYAALFAIVGTTYGVGDGSTTFNLPDLRGRAVAGKDDMGGSAANRLTGTSGGVSGSNLGAAGGDQQHTLTEAQMPAHAHRMYFGTETPESGSGDNAIKNPSAVSGSTSSLTTTVGGGGAHNNVQPTFILNYIIKA